MRIVMNYPRGEGNRLFDGKQHTIEPHKLYRIGNTSFYLMQYSDITANADDCFTILQITPESVYKIPMWNYSKLEEFLQSVKLKPTKLSILGSRISTKKPIDFEDFLEAFEGRVKQPTIKEPDTIPSMKTQTAVRSILQVFISPGNKYYILDTAFPADTKGRSKVNYDGYELVEITREELDKLERLYEIVYIRMVIRAQHAASRKNPPNPPKRPTKAPSSVEPPKGPSFITSVTVYRGRNNDYYLNVQDIDRVLFGSLSERKPIVFEDLQLVRLTEEEFKVLRTNYSIKVVLIELDIKKKPTPTPKPKPVSEPKPDNKEEIVHKPLPRDNRTISIYITEDNEYYLSMSLISLLIDAGIDVFGRDKIKHDGNELVKISIEEYRALVLNLNLNVHQIHISKGKEKKPTPKVKPSKEGQDVIAVPGTTPDGKLILYFYTCEETVHLNDPEELQTNPDVCFSNISLLGTKVFNCTLQELLAGDFENAKNPAIFVMDNNLTVKVNALALEHYINNSRGSLGIYTSHYYEIDNGKYLLVDTRHTREYESNKRR